MDVKRLTYEIIKDLIPEVGEGTSKTYPFIKTHDDLEQEEEGLYGTVVYNFTTVSDLYYDVVISYDSVPKYTYKEKPYQPGDPLTTFAVIDFTADGGYEATNRQELFQIMSTITKILKQEFNRPEVKGNLDRIDYIPAAGKGRDVKGGEEVKKGALQRDELYLAFIKKAVPVERVEYSPEEGNKTKVYLKESYKGKRTNSGAPGTFKAKITKAYGGDVTIEKARKFKNRKNATAHDKRQANWFINFHSKNENLDPSDLTGTGKAAPYGSEYKRLKEEEGFDRVDFYTGFLTSVTPSTFKIEREEDTIVVSNIYAPYPENFDEEDIKQASTLSESVDSNNLKKLTTTTSAPIKESYQFKLTDKDYDEEDKSLLSADYKFSTPNNDYRVEFYSGEHSPESKTFDLSFGLDAGYTNKLDTFQMTGEGNALSILKTIINIIRDFTNRFDVNKLVINPTSEKRGKVYSMILKSLPANILNKIEIIQETVTATQVICDNCGWEWAIKDGGKDLYICHKCGNDNTPPSIEQQMEELLMPHIVSLTGYMVENGLAIDDAPEIHFVDDPDNAEDIFGRTAFYDPNEKSITLYITGRHPKDILRSFAHEMIHYYQDYENRLHQTYTTDINEDDRLMELEREAYEKGNMYFRSWENNLKPGKV
jgi:hypothetical protein